MAEFKGRRHNFSNREDRKHWDCESDFLKDLYETIVDNHDVLSAIDKLADRRKDITGIHKCLCIDVHFLDEDHS